MQVLHKSLLLMWIVYNARMEVMSYEIESGQCGVRKVISPRIVGGSVSSQGSWPWQVMIMEKYPVCGAVLISTEHILTAAHCLLQNETEELTFHLGAHKWDATDSTAVKVNVDTFICHEEYSESSLTFDICLVKLQTPVALSDYIQPVCLPAADSRVEVGEKVTITGWGANLVCTFHTHETINSTCRNSETTPVEYLNEAEVLVIDTSACRQWYRNIGISIPNSHFCAGYHEGGIDSCFGDSGGPLVHEETTNNNVSAYVLRGITSFGHECAKKEKPGVYVRISHLIPWIKENVEALSSGTTTILAIETYTTGDGSMLHHHVSYYLMLTTSLALSYFLLLS